jgi:Trypsin-like peptidase domain
MNPDQARHPPDKTWVAAIHASGTDYSPLGTAVVIEVRVLSCAHVIADLCAAGEPIWVAFPLGDDDAVDQRRLVVNVRLSSAPFDLALLDLAEPVPAGVNPAPLRCPRPRDLKDRYWWAFGFGDGDTYGNSADGLVGEDVGYGVVRLDTGSRYLVQHGFSGGGLWSPDYQAVVGVVGQSNDQ